MSEEIFFFDTYAFFEIIRGNPKYEKYKYTIAITTIFNLAELNYGLKKEHEEKIADEFTDKYEQYLVDVQLSDIKKSMSLRRRHKDLSIPDAVGYLIAKRFNVKFLTGDEGFRDFENVEFVKK
ncbi:MAG TPA: PIN domain-containing protein [Candidatus Nanoarchaeia archaeon]|nr:PIN domain-containing protein [Candidatus Nanoarchaeia archaeon]